MRVTNLSPFIWIFFSFLFRKMSIPIMVKGKCAFEMDLFKLTHEFEYPLIYLKFFHTFFYLMKYEYCDNHVQNIVPFRSEFQIVSEIHKHMTVQNLLLFLAHIVDRG